MPATSQTQRNPRRPEPALEVDHLGYLTDRGHRRAILVGLRRNCRKGRVLNVLVVHETDSSCCERELWAATLARIIGSLLSDGVSVAYLGPDGLVVAQPEGG